MNLTDVDDKIIKRATERGLTITQVTEPVTEIFHRDREYLRIEAAEVYPKATEHIPEMIALVQRLQEKGLAYVAEDASVYFAIARFPSYGRLSRLDTREIRAGARVAADDYNKEDVRDFALWKAAKPEDEKAGGGVGFSLGARPSGLASRVLGDGEALPRATRWTSTRAAWTSSSRITRTRSRSRRGRTGSRSRASGATASSCSPRARRWRSGWGTWRRCRTCATREVSAAAVRHFVFNVHYRKQLNLTDEALEASIVAVRRVGEFADRLGRAEGGTPAMAKAAAELERSGAGGAVRRPERAGGDGGAVQVHHAGERASWMPGGRTGGRWSGRGRRSRW